MFQQFNISRTAFGYYQKMLFNITSNISNAQTPGYKHTRMELATIFPNILNELEAYYAEEDIYNPYNQKGRGAEFGTGARIESIEKDLSQGSIQVTKNELDLAIQGQGFFQFRMPTGRIVYGRAGNLSRDAEGNIMSQSGYTLEPPIKIPENTTGITIDQEGRVFVSRNNEKVPQEIGQVLLARFNDPQALKSVGKNVFEETVDSGPPIMGISSQEGVGELIQFAKETSNVDVIRELMEMIMTRRGLELMGKAMTAGEEMLKKGLEVVA